MSERKLGKSRRNLLTIQTLRIEYVNGGRTDHKVKEKARNFFRVETTLY